MDDDKRDADDNDRLLAAVDEAIADEREACWKAVNDLIRQGELDEPAHSQRNGLVLASNAIRARGTP